MLARLNRTQGLSHNRQSTAGAFRLAKFTRRAPHAQHSRPVFAFMEQKQPESDTQYKCSIVSLDENQVLSVDRAVQNCASSSITLEVDGPSTGSFRRSEFASLLQTSRLGRTLIEAGELPSTQDFLQQFNPQLPNGAVCIADQQTKGRGRGGNKWTSPSGCLMFSFASRLDVDGRKVPFVQYVICLAITEAVASLTRERLDGQGEVMLSIKWPNDLYYKDNKVGGILCQSTYREGRFTLVAGIGLNLDNAEPTTCINEILINKAKKLKIPQGIEPITREELLASLLNELEVFLEVLETQGFSPLQDLYCARWLHSGQRLMVQGEAGEPQTAVTIEGLTETGFLMAVDESGREVELHPDGNSLDMLKGLIKRKITHFNPTGAE